MAFYPGTCFVNVRLDGVPLSLSASSRLSRRRDGVEYPGKWEDGFPGGVTMVATPQETCLYIMYYTRLQTYEASHLQTNDGILRLPVRYNLLTSWDWDTLSE